MLPSFLPMQCSPVDVVPEIDDFVAEIKFDGWRTLAIVQDGAVELRTRGDNEITAVPYINEALGFLPDGTVLDGEMIDPTRIKGAWNRVQSICSTAAEHEPADDNPELRLVIFDVLFLGGTDVRSKPWSQRRQILETLLRDDARPEQLLLADTFQPTNQLLLDLIEQGHEGLVVKRRNSPYTAGKTGAWAKIKPPADQSAEAEITGFTDGKGKYAGKIGAIKFKLPNGRTAHCSGFDDKLRDMMSADPGAFIGSVVEVAHWGETVTGSLRSPIFARLRPDRSAADLAAGGAVPIATKPAAKKPRTAKVKTSKPRTRNYKSMRDPKLLACLESLRSKSGDAYDRCINGGSGDPDADLTVCEQLAAERSLI